MLNTVEMADTYFNLSYFNKSKWAEISSGDKELLLATAEADINVYLKTSNIDLDVIRSTPPFTAYQAAVFEWALYIQQNTEMVSAVTGENLSMATEIVIDGIGKEVYDRGKRDAYLQLIENSPAGRLLQMIFKERVIIR